MALHSGPLKRDTATPAVSLSGVSRSFAGRDVLHNIDLDIQSGEFVALLGRSGSGKSTILRILAGLDDGYRGTVRAPGSPSVAFQDARLLPWATVLGNVALGLKDSKSKARAKELLAEVGLAERGNAWPKTLSGGEAQRAAFARALVRGPQLLLMDEPFGALDALTRIRMHNLVRRLCERYKPAVLLVTHDVDEGLLLADRIIVLDEGRLIDDFVVELPREHRGQDPRFYELRTRLLTALGVEDDH